MFDLNTVLQKAESFGCEVLTDEPMSRHTTFKIGGNADAFITVFSTEQLKNLIDTIRSKGISYMIIGKGSNLLINDDGIRGVVIRLDGEFKEISLEGNVIKCGAAVTLAKLCLFALEHNLSGLEFAYGIPGSVGGAVYMNAGAYGSEVKNVIKNSTHLTPQGKVLTYQADELNLSYRYSRYKDEDNTILFAQFELSEDSADNIKAQMDDFMTRRKTKQPLEYPSAGSVFKRPEGNFAGALIEQCGLKGYKIGGAQVSEKHSGFIVNIGDATCSDVTALVEYVQNTVYMETGYRLEREIILI